MKRPGLKAGSKRQNIRLREKIKKKVAEHKRKERRDAKKNPGQGRSKKQHVPNAAPFKDQIMSEAIGTVVNTEFSHFKKLGHLQKVSKNFSEILEIILYFENV